MKTPVAKRRQPRCLALGRVGWVLLLASLLFCLPAGAQQILVIVRIIEVPHTTLTELLADPAVTGDALHSQALHLAEEGKAEIIDTHAITTRVGQRSYIESIREFVYPTEYEPPEIPSGIGIMPPIMNPHKNWRPPLMVAFETRNAGPTVEVEPRVGVDGLIELRLVWEDVKLAHLITWQEYRDKWGESFTRLPIFTSQRVHSSITLLSGAYELVNVQNPTPAAIPEADNRWLIFIGTHVLAGAVP